jgi:hypothetical protein
MIQIATSNERRTGSETADYPHNSSLELTSAAYPVRGDSDWQPWRTSAAQRHSLYSAARFPQTRVWAFEDFSGFFTKPEVTLVGPAGLDDWCCYGAELTMGLLTTKDPIGFGGGLNWYVYVGNDPVNRVDPTGFQEMTCAQLCENAWVGDNVGGVYCYEPEDESQATMFCCCAGPNDQARPGQESGMCPDIESINATGECLAHPGRDVCPDSPGVHYAEQTELLTLQQITFEYCKIGPYLVSAMQNLCYQGIMDNDWDAMEEFDICWEYACDTASFGGVFYCQQCMASNITPPLGWECEW